MTFLGKRPNSGIRARIGVLHTAAQLKQDLVQCIGGFGLGHGGKLLIGLGAQGSAGGGVTLGTLGIIAGVNQVVGLGADTEGVACLLYTS